MRVKKREGIRETEGKHHSLKLSSSNTEGEAPGEGQQRA